jgi:hypothetical protein
MQLKCSQNEVINRDMRSATAAMKRLLMGNAMQLQEYLITAWPYQQVSRSHYTCMSS